MATKLTKQTTTLPRPRGRPRREVSPADLRKVVQLASRGCHEYMLAHALAMDEDTFLKRKRDTPALVEAIALGRAKWHDRHVDLLNKAADGGNVVASLFILKAKFGFRDQGPPDDQRAPSIIINLPGAAPDLKTYTGNLIEHKGNDDGSE